MDDACKAMHRRYLALGESAQGSLHVQADQIMAELDERWKQVRADLDGDMECVDAVVSIESPTRTYHPCFACLWVVAHSDCAT